MALRKCDADLFANKLDCDHRLPVSPLRNGLLGMYLGFDIFALNGTMLELGGAKSTQADDAAWVVRPRCLGVGNQINRLEISSAVSPRKAIRLAANLAPARVFLVKEIPDNLIFRIPYINDTAGDTKGSSWFSAFPGRVIVPCSLSTFFRIPN